MSDFDWGKEKNLRLFGDEDPPEIKYSHVGGKVKVTIVHGEYDGIISWDLSHRTHLALDPVIDGFLEVKGGHNIFFVSKSMGWFDKGLME